MKLIKTIFIASSLMLLAASCSKWLDVEPNSQIKSSELLRTEAGFKEALAGVYTIMTEDRLYGRELTYAMMGVLSHEWSNYTTTYNEDGVYNYEAAPVQSRINGVWNGMYSAITNTNNLLANIDERRTVFSGDNYAIIKGEAHALRALLHFDLLRLFGAAYLVDPNKPSIPYVTQYAAKQTSQSTVKQAWDLVIEDLKAALELLKVDPVYTGREVTEMEDNGYLLNRQLHLNYYAVEGLLARAYLYAGNLPLAKQHAANVINSNKFSFSTQANLIAGVDYTGAPEHLFALQINNLHQNAVTSMSQEGSAIFSLNQETLATYYDSNTDDYRYLYLFQMGSGANANSRYLLKFREPNSSNAYYRSKASIIKLSEMYFIQAIANLREGTSVLGPINHVRQARGLGAILVEPTNPTETVISEFRKDFIGEGQLFYLYKLLNRNRIFGSDQDLVENKAYILPLPLSELESANRQSNR